MKKISTVSALRWLPPEGTPDEECTILELWSRFHNEIADYQRFLCRDKTITEYTSVLRAIENALQKQKAIEMTAADCLDAVMSVTTYERGGKTEAYKDSSLQKRWAVIRDIFRFCENRFICANPLWLAPWEILGVQPRDVWYKDKETITSELQRNAIRNSTKLQFIPHPAEQKIIQKAVSHLMGPADRLDGLWMGILCYLYLGVRPSEGRGLHFGDFIPFKSHPDYWYCNICRVATAEGGLKSKGKTKNYIRRIPVHPELQTIIEMYRTRLIDEFGYSEDGMKSMPLVCAGTNFLTPCTSLQLMRFVKKQLKDIFGDEELDALLALSYVSSTESGAGVTSDSCADEAANRDFSTRVFRRNFITKLYAETPLAEEDIRAIVGHKQSKNAQADYSEETVFAWLQAISHRMICPEFRSDIRTELTADSELYQTVAGIHDVVLKQNVTSKGLRVVITMLGDAIGGDLRATVQGQLPEGITVTCRQHHFLNDKFEQRRIITDTSHWQLRP